MTTKFATFYLKVLTLLIIALVVMGCSASAAPKVYRVGVLSGLDFFADTTDGFKAEMTKLGYIEGQNITYDMQKTNFDPAAEEKILQKFVADKVDLIFVFPTEASLAAKAATQGTNIPVVFANTNIEGVDLVESVREPGGNITGVRFPGPDIAVKRLEILHEMAPQAKRIWVAYQQGYPNIPPQLEVLDSAAASLGVTLVEVPANNIAEMQADLQARAKAVDIDGMLIIPEPLTASPEAFTAHSNFAAEHKIPFGGILIPVGSQESLFSISTDNIAMGGQAALLADKIFKGIPAGTIPVVSGESQLRINYKAAQALGLAPSEGLLSQAVEIIR